MVGAIAEAMFAQDGEVTAARLDDVVTDVDRYVSAASPEVRFGLRLALFLVRLAPLLMFFRARTLERLALDERVELLSRLERSRVAPLSLAFIGWRTITTLVFYEDPAELRSLGYAGEERLRYKRALPMLGVMPSVPPPQDSGVRLRGEGEHTETAPEKSSGSREVA